MVPSAIFSRRAISLFDNPSDTRVMIWRSRSVSNDGTCSVMALLFGLNGTAIATTIALIVWNVAMASFIRRHLQLLPGVLGFLRSKLTRSLGLRF